MARLARIGDLARELGVSTARLRRLSDLGVIPSEVPQAVTGSTRAAWSAAL